MNKENMSPEEKLLALIKGGKKEVPSPQPPVAGREKGEADPDPRNGQSREAKPDYISEIFKMYFSGNKLFDPDFLRPLNRYLLAAVVILFAYFAFDILFVRPYKNIEKTMSNISLAAARPMEQSKKELSIRLKNYSYYSTRISGKKIFAAASSEGTSGEGKVDIASDIANNIGLVGIIPGSNPQAIIEDKKNQKTYYLAKGQSFDGFTLDEIGEGKVVLEYNGRKIALFL